jgi:hypothetical protein
MSPVKSLISLKVWLLNFSGTKTAAIHVPSVRYLHSITQNQTISSVVNLIFVCATMYLGFIATIYAFRQKRKAKDDFEMRVIKF